MKRIVFSAITLAISFMPTVNLQAQIWPGARGIIDNFFTQPEQQDPRNIIQFIIDASNIENGDPAGNYFYFVRNVINELDAILLELLQRAPELQPLGFYDRLPELQNALEEKARETAQLMAAEQERQAPLSPAVSSIHSEF